MVEKIEPKAACPVCRAMQKLDESEAVRHFRNARKEMLMGVQSLIQLCVDRLDAKTAEPASGPARKVEIS